MKASATIAALLGITYTNAVSMTPYKPGADVENEFGDFLKELVMNRRRQLPTPR